MNRLALLLALAIPVALGGCQTIKSHNPFRHRAPDYQAAREERPLEVPPGIDRPATTDALTIPGEGAGTTTGTAAAPAALPAAVPPPMASSEATPAMAITTRTLSLADTPDSAYRRVGLALARSATGEVTAHDATAHTYAIALDTTVVEKSQGGFLHRLFHRRHKETVHGTVTLAIAAAGTGGSIVTASGETAAVTRVMDVLEQRLK